MNKLRDFSRRHASTLKILRWVPVGIFIHEHIVSLATIDGLSMQPTFNPDSNALRRDVVLLDRCSIQLGVPLQRGDVVTVRPPTHPNGLTVKRVVAIQGDIIRTRDFHTQKTVHIPLGHCWVEGDEAFHSRDSNTYGPISTALIDARVSYIVWPWWRIGEPAPGLLNNSRRRLLKHTEVMPYKDAIDVDGKFDVIRNHPDKLADNPPAD